MPLISKLNINNALEITETNKHGFDLWSWHSHFFLYWWTFGFLLHTLMFCFWVILKTPSFPSSSHFIQKKKKKTKCFCSSVKILQTIFIQIFLFLNFLSRSFLMFSWLNTKFDINMLFEHFCGRQKKTGMCSWPYSLTADNLLLFLLIRAIVGI